MRIKINAFLFFQFTFLGTAFSQSIVPVTVTNYGLTPSGYYFLAPFALSSLAYDPTTYILDGSGTIVYYNVAAGPFSILGGESDFKLQPNGQISYYKDSKFYMMDSTFLNIDSIQCASGFGTDAHEMRILSNGHYLVLGQEIRTMDLSSYTIAGGPGSTTASVIGSVIQEFDQNKNLIFEWKAHDYFSFDDAYDYWLTNGTIVDWTHSNAIEMDTDGHYLLSSRHLNEITKINSTTGNIIWRLNGKHNMFTFTNDTINFTGQHHIRRLSNGNYSLFDNGAFTDPPVARGLEYSMDTSVMTVTLEKQYIQDPIMSSFAMGNTHVLTNGNTLVNHGFIDSGYVSIIVFKPDGSRASEIRLPEAYSTYRSYFYDSLPFEIQRPQVQCIQIAGNWYFSVMGAYPNYLWSTGALTPIIPITSTGEYQVFVPLGNGWVGSEKIQVTNLSDPCATIGIQEIKEEKINCFPNPATDVIVVQGLEGIEDYSIHLYDASTRQIKVSSIQSNKENIYIDISTVETGIYYLTIHTNDLHAVKKIMIK